jgi:hypothetical protein
MRLKGLQLQGWDSIQPATCAMAPTAYCSADVQRKGWRHRRYEPPVSEALSVVL